MITRKIFLPTNLASHHHWLVESTDRRDPPCLPQQILIGPHLVKIWKKAIKCKFLMTSNMHMLKQGHLNEHWNQSLFPSGLRIFNSIFLKQYLLCFKLFKFVEKK